MTVHLIYTVNGTKGEMEFDITYPKWIVDMKPCTWKQHCFDNYELSVLFCRLQRKLREQKDPFSTLVEIKPLVYKFRRSKEHAED
jgi:hypothetical protein